MSKVIAVNAGSSSLKFQLFEMDNETVITCLLYTSKCINISKSHTECFNM